MAKQKYETESTQLNPETPAAPEEVVGFLTWFVSATDRNPKLKAHHMASVREYFKGRGLGESAKPSQYDAALKHYGI